MKNLTRVAAAALTVSLLACGQQPTRPDTVLNPQVHRVTPAGQLRGLWVDAFGPGIKNPTEIDDLVRHAKTLHVNAIFAQIGRRGDCYCNHAAMPRTSDPDVPAGFDPLAYLLQRAHAEGIQVHAWIITTAIHNRTTPPAQPDHVFNTHGPTTTGRDNWLMVRADGSLRGSGADYYLDPGHPDAARYITSMYTSVVRNYDVDGVHFDRVRYPDWNFGINVPSWGYNETALARFREDTGRTDTPAPTDAQWMQWRRDRVTKLVKNTVREVKAIKPHVWVSAATITYGYGPADLEGFHNSRTYVEVLQDWAKWTRQGLLDLNVIMNYKREHLTTEPNNQRLMYEQWNRFAASQLRGDTALAVGSALYLNAQEGSVTQIRKALATPGVSGWVGYSYRVPDSNVNAGTRSRDDAWAELTARLTGAGGPFEEPAAWGAAPTKHAARDDTDRPSTRPHPGVTDVQNDPDERNTPGNAGYR